MEADGKNKSVLAGCEYELCEPTFTIHQVWRGLLTTNEFPIGDSPALILSGQKQQATVTFDQLDQRATALSQRLWIRSQIDRIGRQNEDWIIAVCLPPSSELIVSLLAIFKLGAAYLPLDPAFPSNRVAHILDDAKPAMLITCTAVLGDAHFDDQLVKGLSVYRYDSDQQLDESCQLPQPTGQDLAVVLYTSGSTGVPKGVRLTHRNIYHRLSWQWRTFPFGANEICCFKTAITFVDSIAEIWAPLLRAVPIVVVPKIVTQNPEAFVATLESQRVTRLVLVPSLLAAILTFVGGNNSKSPSGQHHRLQHLRLWVCSGEVLSPQLLRQFFQLFDGQVCNFYGSTEVTGDVTCIVFKNEEEVKNSLLDNRVPLGAAIDNCTIYILSSANEPTESGEIGQVFVSGAHVADGYINGTKNTSFVPNTAEAERKGYEMMYWTGDYGRIVNGQLYFEGRADSQIKVRGHRIDLTEINATVHQLEQVTKGVVLCYKPGQPEQEIIAFVVSNDPSSIHQSLKQKLLSYAMPRVIVVEEIPLLVNGKIDRQLLLKDYVKNYKSEPSICMWNANELDRLDEKERNVASVLLDTVLSVLGGSLHKPLVLFDNYFYIGGNSLNAVTVVTKLRDQGFYLELSDFLEADNFHQVVIKMVSSKCHDSETPCGREQTQNFSDYEIEMLKPDVKEEVKRITCQCLSQKGDLDVLAGVKYEDYKPFLDDVWQHLLDANLSFTVINRQGRIVACGMNFDAFDVPEINPRVKSLNYVFEVMDYAKGQISDWDALVGGKRRYVLQNFLIVTDSALLSPAQNVSLVQYVEKKTLAIAKSNGFHGIFTTNTSPLTQQICNDVLDYQILGEYQVNQFVALDGTQPFARAPNSQLITIGVKYI